MKSRLPLTSGLSFPLAVAIAAFSPASAAIITWDAGGGGGAVTDGGGAWLGANLWNNATVAATWTTGDDAVFGNAGAGGAVTLASPTTVNSLTLNSFTGTYTLGTTTSTITLNNGITKNTGAGAATIISPITLSAAQSWANNSAGLLTVGTGAVANGGFLLTLGGTGNTTISSVISGLGGLTKSDAGIATLAGANTYGGATTINGGVLSVATLANGGAASGIGNSSNAATNLVFGAATATLRHTGAAASTNRSFTLSSGAGGGASIEASGTGALTLDNAVPIAYGTADETRVLTLGGTNALENNFGKVLADNGTAATSLVKNGAGNWLLTAANAYTGGSTVNTGALVFRTLAAKPATGTHAFAAGTTLGLGVGGANFTTTDVDNAFSGALGGNLSNVTVTATTHVGIDTTVGNLSYATDIGSVTKGLTKFGANTLTLGGTNSAYTGATTLVNGTLAVSTLTNAGANSSIGNFPTAGATGLSLVGGTFSYTGTSTTTDRGFTVTGAAKKTISVGTGINLTLGASVKNESIATAAADALNFAASGAGSSITMSSLTIAAGSSPDFNITTNNPTVTIQNLNVTGSNVIAQRTGTALLNVGNITGTGASGWFSNMNITGVVSGYTGTIVLGADVTLSGLNTFDTNVLVQQSGIYRYNSIKSVGGGASALGAPTTVANGTISVGNFGNSPTFRYVGTGDTSNRVLNLRGGATINIEQAGTGELHFTGNTIADTTNTGAKILNFTGSTAGTGKFSGIIVEHTTTNKTSVSKSGTGKWTLAGANVYTGTTTVTAGTLLINGSQTAASGAVSVAANATLGGTGTLGGDTAIADNGRLEFNLSTAPGSHDKLELTTAKALSFGANATLTITSSGGATTGLYTLVTAPGGIGALPAFTVNLPVGWAALPPAISGNDLVINITSIGGSAYDTWKTANAPGSNPGDDTDNDGVTNAVEFVLGGSSATQDLDKLPTVSASGANLTLTFKRAISSIDPKTAVLIETSTDLVTWNTAPSPYTVPDAAIAGPPVTVVEDTPAGFDTVTLAVPQSPDTKKFARLKVVITP